MSSAALSGTRRSNRRISRLIDGYRPLEGVYDELMDETGNPREHWAPVLDGLAEFSPAEIQRRFETADRHLKDSGVFYRVFDDPDGGERSWPLAHVPMVIPDTEWAELSQGLIQRANLLDMILDDVYGEGRLVQEGFLPAAVVAGNPEYVRALADVKVRDGRRLSFYSADIGRGPDGRWWVLQDRAQAPSGAGYALENRIALNRAFPDLRRTLNVEHLAPFFQAYRAGLARLAGRPNARIGVWTPGALNETYFEHAYLARYLGLLLVEGADLVVDGDTVYVRTVEGLKRADVLLRRIDADFADPLELNASSYLGVPGLVQAVRAGNVSIANSLGSGFVEARALIAFLPSLARHLLGEELKLPQVATWWCGQKSERAYVQSRLDELALAPAFPLTQPGLFAEGHVFGSELDLADKANVLQTLERRGVDLVGQEVVHLSTTPVWKDGKLSPHPFTMRVFVASDGDGNYTVMPGGFCRVTDKEDARAVAMGQGVRSTDVWVISDTPVEPVSLIPQRDQTPVRRITGALPSRAADNLFWLGRYLERCEATLRIVRALDQRTTEAASGTSAVPVRRLVEMLVAWGAIPGPQLPSPAAFSAVPAQALTRFDVPGSALVLAQEARRTASVIRERFSRDAWRALEDLAARLQGEGEDERARGDAFERAERALRDVAAFSGLASENMNRMAGWLFLDMGRRIERAVATCRFCRAFADTNATPEMLDLLLDLADSQITYRARYILGAARAPVVDLVALDPANPRSVAFQIERILDHLRALPGGPTDGIKSKAEKAALKLSAEFAVADPTAFDRSRFMVAEQALMAISDEIGARFFIRRKADLAEEGLA
jgi:uncharacterized circularly permuted ATP-grasp superfamily protein/uncharacterized alpha-E superfamily protein